MGFKGIKELCQFWNFQRLPNSANYNSATHFGINSDSFYILMFAIFGKNIHFFMLPYISLYSGFWFFHCTCQIWQKFTTQFSQFWHNSATHFVINSSNFTSCCLPYLVKISTIFKLLYISLHSGFWFFVIVAKFGKNSQPNLT